jgi:two-component system LytT family response regulator
MKRISAVIIEDVPAARESLKHAIQDACPQIELIGEAETIVEASNLIRDLDPDVLFLDVELPDGTAFDLLEQFNDLRSKIIFTTASEAYAVRAFRWAAIDYLLKPIDTEELRIAVDKLSVNNFPDQQLKVLLESLQEKKPSRIALHTMEKIHIVDVQNITRLEANGNYTRFFLCDGSKILVTKTLKEFDHLLSGSGFIRVHQSHLVNEREIRSLVKTDGTYIIMKDGSKVAVATRKRAQVISMLENM